MDWEKVLEQTVSGGYPNDGSAGPASDDDGAPGTTVFGDKYVPVKVKNRLTGTTIKYVPANEIGQEWNYDEFDNSSSMGTRKAYSKTLDSLEDVVGDRMWRYTDKSKSFRIRQDKYLKRKENDIDQTHRLGDDEEDTMEITEKINKYLNEGVEEDNRLDEKDIASSDRKSLARILMSNKNSKVNIKSLGVQAVVTNYDDEIVITYPKNDDFTIALIDIADSLGMDFRKTKDGSKVAFRMMK